MKGSCRRQVRNTTTEGIRRVDQVGGVAPDLWAEQCDCADRPEKDEARGERQETSHRYGLLCRFTAAYQRAPAIIAAVPARAMSAGLPSCSRGRHEVLCIAKSILDEEWYDIEAALTFVMGLTAKARR